jgi:predicted GIY-YIG superfamily endonuclease
LGGWNNFSYLEVSMETVYVLHFSAPILPNKTQHYIGYTKNLAKRLSLHASGRGAKLCAEAIRRGITWEVIETFEVGIGEGRKLETELKSWHGWAKAHCPHCREEYLERKRNWKKSKQSA